VLDENPDLTGGIVERPEWRPLTKFESQGINKEHRVTDFLYTKI
jgi:tRNA (guanine-N7-)-methyltransferase